MGKRNKLKRELNQTKELLKRLYNSTELLMFRSGVCEKCGAPQVLVSGSNGVWKVVHFPRCIFYEVGEFLGVVNTQVAHHSCACYLERIKPPNSETITTRKD